MWMSSDRRLARMHSPEQAAEAVVAYLQQRGIVTIGGDT